MKDIAIIAVGGYNEIGRNMTAIRIGKDIVVMDMGIRLDRVQIHEDTDVGIAACSGPDQYGSHTR